MPKTPCSAADAADAIDADTVDPVVDATPLRRQARRRSATGRFVLLSVLLRSVLLPALGLLGLSACGADNPTRPPEPPESSELYWGLALNHEAITLATGARYDTLRLTAVPLKSTGEALAGLPTPSYMSQDPAKVVVTPDGVLHALEATAQPVVVIAKLTVDNVTHADSVWVRVVDTADPPVLATFVLPPAVDSAKVAMSPFPFMPPLSVQAADDQGQPMNDLLVAFRSSDELIATIDPTTGQITGKWPGPVTFSASATVFGVSKTDSVRYRIGAPIFVGVVAVNKPSSDGSPSPDFPTFTIGVGGAVVWSGAATDTFSVEFDEAAVSNLGPGASFSELNRFFYVRFVCQFLSDCNSAGNVVLAPPITYAIRVFTAPGVYDYRCTACGNAGRVIVVDETQP